MRDVPTDQRLVGLGEQVEVLPEPGEVHLVAEQPGRGADEHRQGARGQRPGHRVQAGAGGDPVGHEEPEQRVHRRAGDHEAARRRPGWRWRPGRSPGRCRSASARPASGDEDPDERLRVVEARVVGRRSPSAAPPGRRRAGRGSSRIATNRWSSRDGAGRTGARRGCPARGRGPRTGRSPCRRRSRRRGCCRCCTRRCIGTPPESSTSGRYAASSASVQRLVLVEQPGLPLRHAEQPAQLPGGAGPPLAAPPG